MLNQQNNQSFNSLIKFNIAFCKLYSLEIQQQKLHKDLLDLQRKILDKHDVHSQTSHLPLKDLEYFFTSIINLFPD